MFTITIEGDDRGISNIKYTGDQNDYVDLDEKTDLHLIRDWMHCINMIDDYYQYKCHLPIAELERIIS